MTVAASPPQEDALPPSLPEDKRPYLGYAITNGKFRFMSVSQIVHSDHRQDAGCLRKWAFEMVFRKKEKIDDPNDPRNRGKRFAREAELYLKHNYDALSPVMRAGKHLLPKPNGCGAGPDLEIEEELAGGPAETKRAIELRDSVLAGKKVSDEEMCAASGLAILGIPLIGAADYAHERGYYVTDGGILVKEPYSDTFEIGDHKVTARIRDHVTKPRKPGAQPNTLPGYAKTPEEIKCHPQMLGYGVRTKQRHPHIRWVRLAHNYYQSKDGYTADKRHILVSIDEVIDRWHGEVAPIARRMVDAAQATKPEDIAYNERACKAFNRECPHAAYCDRPARAFEDFHTATFTPGGSDMDMNSLFPGSSTNGATPPTPAAVASTPPTTPPISEAERARIIAEEKSKLLAAAPRRHPLEGLDTYTVGQPCNGRGFYKELRGDQSGFVNVEEGHRCDVCAQAPALPTVAGVNPADAPPVNFLTASDPLTPEAIAEIQDPTLRAQAEAHARAHAERAAAEAAARAAEKSAKKPAGCSGVGQRLVMTDSHKLTRKARCPGCGKEQKIKDGDIDLASDPLVYVVPKHKIADTGAPPATATSPATPPVAAAVPPALPAQASGPDVGAAMGQVLQQIAADPAQSAAFMEAQRATMAAPPPLPVAAAAAPPPLPPALPVGEKQSTLFVDVLFIRGQSPRNLDDYARDLVKTLQTAAKLDDLRYAPDGHELGYGRWKGALQKMVKANPLPAGEYALYVGSSDVRSEIAEAVADMLGARVVKGAA